tara:strand:- start:51 stop:1298 length:1248 start_codon:yes stop_codon:yes gene_type:complete
MAEQNPGFDLNTPEGNAQYRRWLADQNDGGAPNPTVSSPGPGPNANPFSPTGVNTTVAPVTNPLADAANTALLSGAARAAGGGNTYQVQGGNQEGAFATTGSEGSASSQQQQQFSNTRGIQDQATTGRTTNTGATGVTDTLGFGNLLKEGVGDAKTNDATRNNFLTDLVKTGGEGFNAQVDQAVRQSQSGPTMNGVGDSGKDRAAAYATEAVARNNMGERLQGAAQLAGPTAATSLASAGNPYLGQTTNNTGVNTSNTAGSTEQSTGSFGNLLSSSLSQQTQGGTSSAANTQIAAGNQPEQTTSGGGGGSIICTALAQEGLLSNELVAESTAFIYSNWEHYKRAARGYYCWANGVIAGIHRYRWLARLVLPFARACSQEAARRNGMEVPKRWYNVAIYHTVFQFCNFIGRFVKAN